jgi:hypothetical protein
MFTHYQSLTHRPCHPCTRTHFCRDAACERRAVEVGHLRCAEVNARLELESRRINKERREGEISHGKADRLRAGDRAIRKEERAMAR